jgi:hypothetical protein
MRVNITEEVPGIFALTDIHYKISKIHELWKKYNRSAKATIVPINMRRLANDL